MSSPAPHRAPAQDKASDAILAIRRTHEAVVQRSLRTLFQGVVDLAGGEAIGYQALAGSGAAGAASARCEQLAAATECRATDRLRQLFRRLAAEESIGLPYGARLFLAVTGAESAAGWLLNHLCQLRDIITSSRQLVVEIPDNAVRNTEEFRALLASLRDAGIGLAYDGYASGRSQIAERKDIAPAYLKLAPSMFSGIQWGKDRQRQLQLIVRASHDLGSTVIATGINNKIDLQVCRELGCTLAQGDLFGQPQSPSALAGAPHGAPRVHELAK